MSSLFFSFAILMVALLAPLPFLRDARTRRSLAILALMVAGIAGLTYALAMERGAVANMALFFGMIALFWLAGRFEAK